MKKTVKQEESGFSSITRNVDAEHFSWTNTNNACKPGVKEKTGKFTKPVNIGTVYADTKK